MLSFIASGDTAEWKLVIADVRNFWEDTAREEKDQRGEEIYVKSGLDYRVI